MVFAPRATAKRPWVAAGSEKRVGQYGPVMICRILGPFWVRREVVEGDVRAEVELGGEMHTVVR